MKKHHEYSILGFKALKRATLQAVKEAQMHNYKVPNWESGKIIVEAPESITEQSASPDRNSVKRYPGR